MPAHALVKLLARRGLTVACAESFTGGLLLDALTDVPGASTVLQGGVVAYADSAKRSHLSVAASILKAHGAVSGPTARAMARGVRRRFRADVGIATTGIAGPTGATATKPIGLSYVAVALGRRTWVDRAVHRGGRRRVKVLAVEQALRLLKAVLARSQRRARRPNG